MAERPETGTPVEPADTGALTLLGDNDAAVCVDGSCAIPDTTPSREGARS
ncbi:hypothetical protein [Sinosporangium album]|nr:hypothetical protein [Sinosporangium album]